MRGQNKISVVKQISECHIGIDLLGSEMPSGELFQAIIDFKPRLKDSVRLTLLGTEDLRKQALTLPDGILFHPVQEMISMDDDPLHAIRHKKQSSLYLGIQMLKEAHLDAFISTGNTGALMAGSKLLLSTISDVERPALLTLLPTRTTDVAVLDVGANISYKAKHLVQFALMGVSFQKSRGITTPRVGLLNIGSEARKGTPELRVAYESIREKSHCSSFAFVGNIEAREVFQGGVDVLVTDGFTGNIFLKTAEGIGMVILEELEASTKDPCFKTAMSSLRQHLHYAEYPGALLCGVKGIVIKCHGNATAQSVLSSISSAVRLVEHRFLETVHDHFNRCLNK